MWKFIKQYPAKYLRYYLAGFVFLVVTTYVTTLIPLKIKHAVDLIQLSSTSSVMLRQAVFMIIGLALVLVVCRTLSRILIFIPGRFVE